MTDDDDLGLRAWQVPAPPTDLVARIAARVEATATTSAAVPQEPPRSRRPRRGVVVGLLVGGALCAAVAAAAVLATTGEHERDASQPAIATGPAQDAAGSAAIACDLSPDAGVSPPPVRTRRMAGPKERAEVLRRIADARARREATRAAAGGGAGDDGAKTPDAPAMDPEEIRTSVREVIPLLAECFEMAPEALQAQGGTVVAYMVLSGEPDVGTVIEDVALEDDTSPHFLADADFAECITETLFSVQMPPVGDGGVVEIRYPFVFALEEPTDPAPVPPSRATPNRDVAQHIDWANNAARNGRYNDAIRYASRALELAPGNQQALTTLAIAACNVKNASLARAAIAQLTGQRAGMAKQVCLRHGIDVDAP